MTAKLWRPHEHVYVTDPDRGEPWQRCSAVPDCDAIRHRPLRDGGPAGHPTANVCPATGGDHAWQPVSFVFETQLLDHHGRVQVRQPDLDEARVYLVCVPCRSHTYVETAWVGYRLYGPFEEELTAELAREDTT